MYVCRVFVMNTITFVRVCVCVCVVEYKVCAEVPVHNIISFYSLFLLPFLLLCVSTRETKRQTLLLSKSVLINSL